MEQTDEQQRPALPALLDEARHALGAGAPADARVLAERALAIAPHSLDARLIANQAAFLAGDHTGALRHAEAGEVLHPGYPDFPLRRARALLMGNHVAQARAALDVAETNTAPDTPASVWGMIGDAHTLLNQFERAQSAYTCAIARDPEAALHWFNRGVVSRYLGHTAEAARDFESAVALDPDYAEAWLNLVQTARQTPADNPIASLAAMLERLPAHAQRQRLQGHYALAKCYEDLGEGLTSFAHLDAGARLMRAGLQYDLRADQAAIALIQARFPAPDPRPRAAGFEGVRPIFVLGLPRSGSTVIERILTSHSAVDTIGESPAFGQALADMAREAGVDPADPGALIRAMPMLDPAAIGRRYAALTAPWRGSEALFVDKLPTNHLYIGLIAQALPQAKIVHTVRHPLANLYGIYKTLFNRAYPWSYNLDELVGYYAAYRDLMAHWRRRLGPRLIEVSYETMVERPEPVIRQLVADCGLDWQPACLAFHANRRPSTTQSAVQVRAALNRDGIERWRRFEPLLAPLRRRIEAIGVDCG